jgi:diguanylate cyclase (GGDEF)-like protein
MIADSPRSEQANADVLLWQTRYRVALALLAGALAVALRTVGIVSLSPVAEATIGTNVADWMLGLVSVVYVVFVLGMQRWVQRTRRVGHTLSTAMVLADLAVVFWLVFLLSTPQDYDRALLVALFSMQLTHVYFGRLPALLMLVAIAVLYMLLVDIAIRFGGDVRWSEAFTTITIFGVGALLVTRVQSNLHRRLANLVAIFERAEEGDFASEYAVSDDMLPDAITMVGRAYNRMRSQLATIVLRDPLSGCFNRRGFEQQYRRELARAARTHTDLALLSIDLDHFKQINDTYGHLVGDQVISETGELLRASARADDLVARTGGEEFVILAPNTSVAGAQNLALRIVEAFRRRTFGEPNARAAITVSIGVVADSITSESIAEDLLSRSDEALYAAKRSGRDRVVLWSHGLNALRLKDTAHDGSRTPEPPPAKGPTGRASFRR